MTASAEEDPSGGTVRTLDGHVALSGARLIELVFRTVGERTSDLALELAIRHIRPNRVHVIDHVKPFSHAVARMLEIKHACSYVVYVDADCLILEDLRPFLDDNALPYVDCYVRDRFRGRIHCGVHITRIDVVRRMREVPVPENDLAYVLRPESRLRNLAMNEFGPYNLYKQVKGFHILHDHFQHFADIFVKYALRELRSRTEFQRRRLEGSMGRWGRGFDFDVARTAIAHAARTVAPTAQPEHVEQYIRDLPHIAQRAVARMGLPDQRPLTMRDVHTAMEEDMEALGPPRKQAKVFGLGLSQTGTRSLTEAVRMLGFDTVHYPTDRRTLQALKRGDGRFPLLEHYDGITDATTIPFLAELDALHPGAKFVLTVREKDGWLEACEYEWCKHPTFELPRSEEHAIHLEVRRFLWAAVYGCHEFDPQYLSRAYDEHVARIQAYFRDRSSDLLVLDVWGGEGWEKLASFLGCASPDQPFPPMEKSLSGKSAEPEVTD